MYVGQQSFVHQLIYQGNLHLTTHRLLFHAMLPPESALPHANSGSGESSNQHHSIIHSGPVTIHRPGVLRPARRWLELTADMVTSYPRADESGRIRPIRCVLCESTPVDQGSILISVSSVSQLEPFDPEHPNDFRMVYQTANGTERTHMSVDTEQSAMQWRRAFEGALFRHAHSMWKAQHAKKMGLGSEAAGDDQWTMMRACVPLDRIRVSGMQDYHNFVTLLGLEIDLRGEKVDFSPENDLEADHDGHQDHAPTVPSIGIERTDSPSTMSPNSTLRAPPLSPPALDGHGRFPCERTQKLVSRFSSMSHSSATSELKAPSPARTPSQVSQMSTTSTDGTKSPGIDTPTKKFSLRNTLDKLAPSHSHSRDPSPAPHQKASTGPQWLDSTIPGPLAKAAGGIISGKPEDWGEVGPESEYSFNVAVQQEQTWFVGSLQAAVAEAKQRRYKAGAKRPKMVLNVAGYDCLVTDEDLDHTIKPHEEPSSDSGEEHEEHSSPDEMEDGPDVGRPSMLKVKAARKAEKASMAAKIFGLDESEGIWRESLTCE